MSRDEVVDGAVEEVVFASEDGRFSVVRFSRLKRDDEFVGVGDLGAVAVGETLRLQGRWSQHAVFGRRFQVQAFTPIVPDTTKGIIRYLGSGLIPGIGKRLAERLVDRFGDQTLDVIASQSTRLREVSGIGKQRASAISEAVRARRDEAELLAFLHGVGLGPFLARKVLRHYGQDAARVLREDPYLVAEQISGIGFRKADDIGRSLGIGPEDPRRAAGAALHVLARASDRGHVFLERMQVVEEARRLGLPPEKVDAAIDVLALRGLVILEEDDVYPPPLHRAERLVAKAFRTLARPRKTPEGIDAAVTKATEGLSLSERQALAVRTSLEAGLSVLTGGPGTGKTTTVRAIVRAQQALERRILLCAPTGRAAKRLTEATGAEATTIHRMLEWNPMLGGFQRGSEQPLEAEVVLVDEASMLNLQLASSLLEAVAPSTRLILVGDVDQLPPVGAGQVLRELIASEVGAVVRLEEVFRQAAESAIVQGAHAILRGDVPTSTPTGAPIGPGDL
ncbi:MAG: AAA family ATPase, partial [Myxococcota bacterium]